MWTMINCEVVELTEWQGRFTEAEVVMEADLFQVFASEIENGIFDCTGCAEFAEISRSMWEKFKLLNQLPYDYIVVDIERFEDPDDKWNGGEPWLEVTGISCWQGEEPNLTQDMMHVQDLLGSVDY